MDENKNEKLMNSELDEKNTEDVVGGDFFTTEYGYGTKICPFCGRVIKYRTPQDIMRHEIRCKEAHAQK